MKSQMNSTDHSLPGTRGLPALFLLAGKGPASDPAGWPLHFWKVHPTGSDPALLEVSAELPPFSGSLTLSAVIRAAGKAYPGRGFPEPAGIEGLSGDMVALHYPPREDLQVNALLWTPEREVICGEIEASNLGQASADLTLDLLFHLESILPEARLDPTVHLGKNILRAGGGGLYLAGFLSGGALPLDGTDPGLRTSLRLGSRQSQVLRWILVLARSGEEAARKLDQTIALSWKAEISRRKISNQDRLLISLDDPEWDLALDYSRWQAENYLNQLAEAASLPGRWPISSLDGLLLYDALFPLQPQAVEKFLDLIFPRQDHTPRHDSEGQFPLQAELLSRLHQDHQLMPERLASLLPFALAALSSWFTDHRDQDRDGVPEIPKADYFDLLPIASRRPAAHDPQPASNPFLESPGLSALLLNEIRHLERLWEVAEPGRSAPGISSRQQPLIDHISASWQHGLAIFLSRDSASHRVSSGQVLGRELSPGLQILRASLAQPSRIGLLVSGAISPAVLGELRITIHGLDPQGCYRIERIPPSRIHWDRGSAWAYSKLIYTRLDFLYFEGARGLRLDLTTPRTDQQEISTLFPLLLKSSPRDQLQTLLAKSLTSPERFWTPFGIRSRLDPERNDVQFPWNYLLVEALLRNGQQLTAAELFSQLLRTRLASIGSSGQFHTGVDSQTGRGVGSGLSPGGLFPVRLLLRTAGIHLSGRGKLLVEGEYPFEFPLILQFRGTRLERWPQKTLLRIPGEAEVSDSQLLGKLVQLP